MKIKKQIFGILILSATLAAGMLLGGCGGGGGSRGESTVTPTTSVVVKKGKVTARVMIATANAGRVAPRAADAFLSRIPANTPQEIDTPDSGYESLSGATVATTSGGKVTTATTDANGNWTMSDLPEGTDQFVVTKNGKSVTIPITVEGDTTNNELALITEDDGGDWVAETQTIHGDGTDGYKKETHCDKTSDTVFEGGTRDHHQSDGNTLRDVTDDGIVDQQFSDPDDDGNPDGPITETGGSAIEDETDQSSAVNNQTPEISSLDSKDDNGKKNDTVESGDTLQLDVNAGDPDGDTLTVEWTVLDAYGNDVTNLFISNPNAVEPTFSPPQGEYQKPGAYEVVATVTDPSGAESEKDIIVTVDSPDNKTPHASIKANHTSGEAPLTVTFTCDAFDKDGSIVSYCWDFDKSNGIDQNDCDDTDPEVTKTFISEGKYRVTCIVTDDKGATAFAKRVVVVRKTNSEPVISSVTASKTTASPGETVRVTVTASDADGDALTTEFTATGGTISDTSTSDSYAEWTAPTTAGEYLIEVTVTDTSGAEDIDTVSVRVESDRNKPPTVNAAATPATGNSPLNVSLSAIASDPDGDTVTLTWDFNDKDGIQIDASGTAATVEYGAPGGYTATVKACDSKGACAWDKVAITVTQPNRAPFVSSCSAAATSAEVGDVVALIVQASDDDYDQLTYSWSVSSGTLSSSTDQMPDWTLPPSAGTYTATVAVSDGHSTTFCTAELSVTPEVLEKQPDPPTECSVTAGDAKTLLQWTLSESADVEHYKILRSVSGGDYSVLSSSVSKTVVSYEDNGLSNGSEYRYKIVAVNANGFESAACEQGMTAKPEAVVDVVTPVGDDPSDSEYEPVTDRIYVPVTGDDKVTVVNRDTGEVIAQIAVGDQPIDACADSARRVVYVTNKGSDTVSVIDETSLTVVKTIPVGDAPSSCVVNNDTGDVYVGNESSGTVSVIDGDTRQVKGTIGNAGDQPRVCDINENLDRAYWTDRVNNKLHIIDTTTNTEVAVVDTGDGPEGCVSNDQTGEVYVPNKDAGTVDVFRGTDGQKKDTIDVGGEPTCTCSVNTISNQIYIVNKKHNVVHLINGATKQVDAAIGTGDEPISTCAVSSSNEVCFANSGGDSLTVIENPLPPYVVDPYPPSTPQPCYSFSKGSQVAMEWTACADDDLYGYQIMRGGSLSGPFEAIATVLNDTQYIDTSVVNGSKYYYEIKCLDVNGNLGNACTAEGAPLGEIVEVVKTGGKGPCCMDTIENKIFIANEETNTVEVINSDTYQHITTINVPDCCTDMVADHVHNLIYITNKTENKVTIINGTNYVIEDVIEIPKGKCSINDITNNIYITNDETNELIIYNPGTGEHRTVYVGGCPCDVTSDRITNKIFVTNKTTNKLTVIDGTNYIIEDVIDLDVEPSACIVNEVTNETYIVSEKSNEVVVYNQKTETITNHITVGVGPSCSPCAVDTESNQIFVTNTVDGTLSIIDGSTNTVVATLPLGETPIAAFVNPDTGGIFVLDGTTDSLAVVDNPLPDVEADTTAPAAPTGFTAISSSTSISLGWAPNTESDLAMYFIYRKTDPGGDFGTPYTTTTNSTYTDTSVGSGTVYYYAVSAADRWNNESGKTVTLSGRIDQPTEITVGGYPFRAAVFETSNYVFVTNYNTDNVSVINAVNNTVATTVAVGDMPVGVDVDTTSGKVYVANLGAPYVTVLNGSTGALLANAMVGTAPLSGITVDSSLGRYFVTNPGMTGLIIPMNIATNTPVGSITVGAGASGITVNPATHRLYVANSLAGTVSEVDGSTGAVVRVFTVGSQPVEVVYDSTANKVFASCSGSGKVYTVDLTSETISSITVGLEPSGMGYDSGRHLIYVANTSSGTVSVIDALSDRVVGTIDVGGDPTDVAVHTGLNKIFVLEKTAGTVVVKSGF